MWSTLERQFDNFWHANESFRLQCIPTIYIEVEQETNESLEKANSLPLITGHERLTDESSISDYMLCLKHHSYAVAQQHEEQFERGTLTHLSQIADIPLLNDRKLTSVASIRTGNTSLSVMYHYEQKPDHYIELQTLKAEIYARYRSGLKKIS